MSIISTSFRGDLKGGAASALLTIPLAIGFGMFAFAPLGDRFTQFAILAGLYSAIIVPSVGVILRSNSPVVLAPRSMTSFLISGVIIHFLAVETARDVSNPSQLLTVVFLIMLTAGIFQSMFGVLRLGELVKYIPHPVIAGFQNGAALLLLLAQIDPMLGLHHHVPIAQAGNNITLIQPLTLTVGVVSCTLMMNASRLTKRIPAVIIGLFGGIGLYYLLYALGLGVWLGPVIGEIAFELPGLRHVRGIFDALQDPAVHRMAPLIIAWSASLALMSSLDALLCAKVMEGVTRQRTDSNFDLIRLGIGNAVAALFGSIASAVSLTSSQANYNSGGRSRYSILASSVLIFVAAYFLTGLIALLPKVVVAGLLVVTAIRLFDPWTLQMLRQLATGDAARRRNLAGDLAIIFLVTGLAVLADLVVAVGIGILIAIGSFLIRMSRSVVRRAYRCDTAHSRKVREERIMTLLAQHGKKIAVFELEGSLFFGTAEKLADEIERTVEHGVNYIILDLKRVTDVDSTGARLLLDVQDKLVRRGKFIALTTIPERPRISGFLRDIGVIAAFTRGRVFSDTDRAIEWAEDHLILAELGDLEIGSEFPFRSLEVLQALTDDELEVLKDKLRRQTFESGQQVFAEGAESKELYIIARGSASVKIRLAGTERETRLVTFAPGTLFGEIALLDTEPRSATVTSDEPLVCYVLSADDFDMIKKSHPAVAIKLLTNLGRELSSRLRRANRIIYQLDT
jgi:MFS superfamily sulfate permease-like transporter